MDASTPVYSPPWMLPLMNTGTLKSPNLSIISCAFSGSFSIAWRMAWYWPNRPMASGADRVTRNRFRPPADWPITSTLTRSLGAISE